MVLNILTQYPLPTAFPPHWHHATAVKTCPLSGLLKIAKREGHGAECASIGEVLHALALGFDGPVSLKSPWLLLHALALGFDGAATLKSPWVYA